MPYQPHVSSSVYTGDSLLTLLTAEYGLPGDASCIYFARGVNDTYQVESNDRYYYLRIYRHTLRSKEDIEFELAALRYLRANQFPAAAAIPTNDGSLLFSINAPEGKRYGALFSNAPGRPPGTKLNQQQATLIGMRLAEMHTLLQSFTPPGAMRKLGMHELLDEPWQYLWPMLQHRKYAVLYKQLHDDVKQSLKQLPKNQQTMSVLAGDVHGSNLHFCIENEITFFDFDQCGYGWRAFDLAKFLSWAQSSGLSMKIRAAFMTAYQRLRPLTEAELNAIPALMQAAVFWMMGQRARLIDVVPANTWSNDYFLHRLQLLESFAKTGHTLKAAANQ